MQLQPVGVAVVLAHGRCLASVYTEREAEREGDKGGREGEYRGGREEGEKRMRERKERDKREGRGAVDQCGPLFYRLASVCQPLPGDPGPVTVGSCVSE